MGVPMGQRIPAVVGLYFRDAGQWRSTAQWRRIAEFRLTADGHATFRAVDPIEGLVARVWYHQGVELLGTDRRVLPADGAAFLRALLQPFGFRDYWFRDDSSPRSGLTRTRHTVSRTGPIEGESDWATADPECDRCGETESEDVETGRHPASRPAAWRLLDADVLRF
ncbi:hypothetical protein ACFXHA_30960 [Nocardia sp. NPDC059240]|uniref:hypothetical protein n=1 Tax=Nocardia sp. NPDC059240 TaxID=3346786 RepID=UPI0036BE3B90